MKLETGDIVLFDSRAKLKSPSSWVVPFIKFFTKSDVNHAEIIMGDDTWGARPKGILHNSYEEELNDERIVVLRPRFKFDTERLCSEIKACDGKPYDYSALLFHQLLFQTTHIWLGRNGGRAKGKLYCSEFVAYLYRNEVPYFAEYWKITPADIYEIRNSYFDVVFEGLYKK